MQTFNLDLTTKGIQPLLNAKQGDVGRKFKAVITDGSAGYQIPANAEFSVWYSGTGGEGNYTMIGDHKAISIDGNTVTVELITQMLNLPGNGRLCLTMDADGTNISTWNIPYFVESVPGMGSKTATQYFNDLKNTAERAAASAQEAANSAAEATQAAEKLETDESLSVSGVAADAKATGERIATVEGKAADLAQEVLENGAKIGAVSIVCGAEGEVVTLKDAAELPLPELKIFGKTTQDGTPTPDAPIELESIGDGGSIGVIVAGKNLLKNTGATQSVNGITFTANEDGSVTVSGTAAAQAGFLVSDKRLANGVYILSGCSGPVKVFATLRKEGGEIEYFNSAFDMEVMFTVDDSVLSMNVAIQVAAGVTVNNETVHPMIRHASISDSTYEPYKEAQVLALSTPNGLPGLPVSSGGNYTDSKGQQWICDVKDYARGKRIKRMEKLSLKVSDMDNGENYPGWKNVPEIARAFVGFSGYLRDRSSFVSNIAQGGTAAVSVNALGGNGILFLPISEYWGKTQSEWKANYPDLVFEIIFTIDPVETDLPADEMAAYAALHTNKPNTTIYNDAGAYMSAAYTVDTKVYVDSLRDDQDYGLPVLRLTGDAAAMTKDHAVTLQYRYQGREGNCTVKWQGTSSLAYPKKNYTIKFDTAFEAREGWGEQKKYCLKANYIDPSHARNLVCAGLWSRLVASRGDGLFATLPKHGAVDGFPVIVELNGEFVGLYTFNIPKEGWMFGLSDSTLSQAIVCAEGKATSGASAFKETAKLDETDFSLEYVSDEDNAEWAKTSLNRLITACMNSDGSDLDTTVAQYLDWQSAIDFYCFACLIGGYDLMVKNYLLVTLDGTKWYFSAYDMDSTFGLDWQGKFFHNPATCAPTPAGYRYEHRVMELIATYKKDALKQRWDYIRKNVLSTWNVHTDFYNFAAAIPANVLEKDWRKWPSIPNTSGNTYPQIMDWYRNRVEAMDAAMANL